jgi:ferredoxin
MTGQRYSIDIDRETRMGSGVCVASASPTFAIDDETKSTAKNPEGNPLGEIEVGCVGARQAPGKSDSRQPPRTTTQ